MRKKESQHLEEGIEVVESFDGDEEAGEEESQEVEQKSKRSIRGMGRSMRKGRSSKSETNSSTGGGSRSRKSMSPRGKSKRLGRDQNEVDPNEEDDEGEFL